MTFQNSRIKFNILPVKHKICIILFNYLTGCNSNAICNFNLL